MLAIYGGEPLKKDAFPGWPQTGEIDRETLTKAVEAMGNSNFRARFEEKFARDAGVKHCFAVANGTVSLEMILRAMGIGYGDEVILPPYTFVATLSSIIFAGATPVFADIDEGTYNLSHETLEEKITKKTRAIVAVAVAGCPPKIDELSEIAKKHGVKLILDAAQAVGAEWNGKNICAWGDAASVSCQNSKNLTSGEGGIITTNDDELAEKIALLLNGGKKDGKYVSVAQDHNISELQAAILLSQYEKLKKEMYLREKNAAYLAGRMKDFPFASPAEYDARIGRHAYHLFLVRFNSEVLASRGLDRNTFLNALNVEGIPLCPGYSPLYAFPCTTAAETERIIGRKIDVTPLPNSEKAGYEEGSWLYQACLLGTRKDMDDIADAMLKVWEHADELNGR